MKSAHATVWVSQFDQSLVFYRDTLGLALGLCVPGHWAELTTPDGFTVALHPADPSRETASPLGISIGFGVDDLDAKREALEGLGVRFSGPTVDTPPVRLAYFSDPDGYPLYLSEVRETEHNTED